MKKREQERLKDILIDHIYDFCFNEVVKKIEGDDDKLTLDVGMKIEDDPITSLLFNRIKKAKKIKAYHASRNQTYYKVLQIEI